MKVLKYVLCGALLALPLMSTHCLQAQTTSTPKSTGTPKATTSTTPSATGAASPTNPAPPAHPITIEQTREMYELMGFKKMMNGMLTQTISMQKQQAPFVPQDVWTDLQTSFDNVDYVTVFQPIYAKYLSEEDAAKSLEFYRTPAGRHMLEVMPPLMHDIMLASQQKGQEVGRQVIDRHRAEIEAAQKKYQQEHEAQSPQPATGTRPAPPSLKTPPPAATPAPSPQKP
jgi:hypothetical protein